MEVALGAVIGAVAAALIGRLLVSAVEVDRHDRQIAERDQDFEEWIVVRHRQFKQRLNELTQDANERGVVGGSAIRAGRVATQTLLLYDYREELRQARNFVLAIEVEERWTHALMRKVKRQPFPSLTTPIRAERLVDYWSEGTARNALTWSLEDILGELPQRATSRALAT